MSYIKTTRDIILNYYLYLDENDTLFQYWEQKKSIDASIEWICIDKVRQEIDDFEDTLITALGWNKPEDHLNRGNLGRKFDILRYELGLLGKQPNPFKIVDWENANTGNVPVNKSKKKSKSKCAMLWQEGKASGGGGL